MLKRLIVSATSLEIEVWLAAKGYPHQAAWRPGLYTIDPYTDLLLTGVGAASCACMLGAHLANYSTVYQVGFAGAYASSPLRVGQCVTVQYDAFAHYALERVGIPCALEQMGLSQAAAPMPNGAWLATCGELPAAWQAFPVVSGLTVEKPSGCSVAPPPWLRHEPSVETMEGAAFALAMASIPADSPRTFASLRVISNYVMPSESAAWDIPLAQRGLAEALAALEEEPRVLLRWAISPCPNDTFTFAAIAQGIVESGICHSLDLLDIAALNQAALAQRYDVVKVSAALYPAIALRYEILPVGAALGYGVGPLLVSTRPDMPLPGADDRVLVPGRTTTAYALLRLFCPDVLQTPEVIFSDVIPLLQRGECEYGILIHEGRFTYQQQGLHLVADLGAMWEQRYALPLPLGIICARRSLALPLRRAVVRAIRSSLTYAWANRQAVRPYVAQHAQEMHPAVQAAHIHLYVNGYSYSLGAEGVEAIDVLGRALR